MRELEREIIKERNPETERYRLGDSEKAVFLLRQDGENAILVIPEGVEVKRVLTKEDIEAMKKSGKEMPLLKIMSEGVYQIVPGEYIAVDVKDGEIKGRAAIKFNPNSHNLQKKAA